MLLFGPDDLPQLRANAASPSCAALWQRLQQSAKDLCTAGSPAFADPAMLHDGTTADKRPQIIGHVYGRRLTDWMETIGFVYQLTRDPKLLSHGGRLLAEATKQLPVDDPQIHQSFAGARGDILRGLTLGYDWLGEGLSDAERAALEEVMAGYIRNLIEEGTRAGTWWRPYHNFTGVGLGAAGLAAVRLRGRFPEQATQWEVTCADAISMYLDEGYDEEGACAEGAPYGLYGLSNALLFAEAARRNGGPPLMQHPRLPRIVEFYAQSLLPGEAVFDARNDANYSGPDTTFLLLARSLNSGLARWIWDRAGGSSSPLQIIWINTPSPVSPTEAGVPLSQWFQGRGLCVFRTGWDTKDVMFSIEAGRYYKVTHNQADKGHFTLYGMGHRWAIDSGYGNNREPEGRAQTVAHNCVLVDGEGQALSGAGIGTDGKIIACESDARADYVAADCTDAYRVNSAGQPGPVLQRAIRHALFVRPSQGAQPYAIVLDDMLKDEADHAWTWLMHTDESLEIRTHEGGATLRAPDADAGAYVETPLDSTGAGQCRWTFALDEAGEYEVWAKVRSSGPNPASADSFFVQVDNGAWIAWHMPGSKQWTWGKVGDGVPAKPVTFRLEPGTHHLTFKTRETGAQVNCAVVVPVGTVAPFLGLPRLRAEAAEVTAPMVRISAEGAAPAHMELALHASGPVTEVVDAYNGHPRLTATVRGKQPGFVAVLLPLPGDVAAPKVSFERQGGALLVTVQWPARTDRILWPDGGARRPRLSVQ